MSFNAVFFQELTPQGFSEACVNADLVEAVTRSMSSPNASEVYMSGRNMMTVRGSVSEVYEKLNGASTLPPSKVESPSAATTSHEDVERQVKEVTDKFVSVGKIAQGFLKSV